MTDRLPFPVSGDSAAAFAHAYAAHSGASWNTVSAVVESVADWHRVARVTARSGVLAGRTRHQRRLLRRDEKRARRACQQYVREHVPQALGIIGWIQIALWLWRNRQLIAEIIRLFRKFLADRPAAFQSVLGET